MGFPVRALSSRDVWSVGILLTERKDLWISGFEIRLIVCRSSFKQESPTREIPLHEKNNTANCIVRSAAGLPFSFSGTDTLMVT